MQSTLFDQENLEHESTGLFTAQSSKMIKADTRHGEILARQGAMIAYQGDANFEHEGMEMSADGLKRMLKKAVTGEGLPLMRITGQADVFLADMAANVHVIELENDRLSVNGMNILAFSSQLDWDIELMRHAGILAGGLFNTTLSGSGQVALTSQGNPLVLETAQPTYVDPDAAVCWSAELNVSLQTNMSFKSLIGRGSGEAAQLAFQGSGYVVVQPAESMRGGGSRQQNQQQGGQQGGGFNVGQFLSG